MKLVRTGHRNSGIFAGFQIGALLNLLRSALAINLGGEETYISVDVDGIATLITFDL